MWSIDLAARDRALALRRPSPAVQGMLPHCGWSITTEMAERERATVRTGIRSDHARS
jgi:hypothetical protein